MTTIRQLRYLTALAETRHFSKAAEVCHVTQPALSTQLKALEDRLGLQLIERRRNATDFTDDGHEILRRAQDIIAAVRDLEDFAHQRRGLLVGPLGLGIIPSIAPYLLPLCLDNIQRRFPRLELRLRETQTSTLLAELGNGQIDAAIMALPVEQPGLKIAPLFRDPFLLAMSTARAENFPRTVTPDLIPLDELLLLEEGHCLRDQALKYCHTINPGRLSTFGATSLTTMLQMVGAGYGMTLLPEMVVRSGIDTQRIALRRFRSPEPSRQIALVWRTTSPRKKDFMTLRKILCDCYVSP